MRPVHVSTSGASDPAAVGRAARLRPLLESPCCGGPPADRAAGLRCRNCGRAFPIVRGVPILLPEVSSEWIRQTEEKLRFTSKPSWRRRLLNPSLTNSGPQRRRIREFLSAYGEEALVMDVGSSLRRLSSSIVCFDLIPTEGVDLVGDLHRMPIATASLDAVICTGVLEHVENADQVVSELWRVLKPGGRIYVSLPFLQGYHPSPTDFHRFTRDGARRLLSRFEIDELVNTRGSGSVITWIVPSFLAELLSFGNLRLYGVTKAFFSWIFLPLKYLDYWLAENRFDHYITSGFTVIATKSTRGEAPSASVPGNAPAAASE